MDGVILFADDKIYDYEFTPESKTFDQSDENRLFKNLANIHPVLGVKTLHAAEKSLKKIGTFSAVILDWQFDNADMASALEGLEGDESVAYVSRGSTKDEETFNFLMRNEIYSLIYIYSTAAEEIKQKYGEQLEQKYPGRIFIYNKENIKNSDSEREKILSDIDEWNKKNKNLSVPFIWSQSIIQAVQRIFSKLYAIDPNWLAELYNTSVTDGVNPEIEVVNLFQNILSENIIQDNELLSKIAEAAKEGSRLSRPEDYAKLIRILYYGQSNLNDPIMTGDIFRIDALKFAVIVTPECDIRHVAKDPANNEYEVLSFSKDDFKKIPFKLKAKIKASPVINKAEEFKLCKFNKPQKIEIARSLNSQIEEAELNLQIEAFTQTNPRIHLLPCFEFESENFSGVAAIDFRSGLSLVKGNTLNPATRVCKLNTPYIQELRQRYLAYKGRVGVSGYSEDLRKWLISNI